MNILAFVAVDPAELWKGLKHGARSLPLGDSAPDRLIVWHPERGKLKAQVPCTVRLRRDGGFMLDAPYAHIQPMSGMVMDLQTLLDNPPPLRFDLQPTVVLYTEGAPSLYSGEEASMVRTVRVVTFSTRGEPIVRDATADEVARWVHAGAANLKAIYADGFQVREFRPDVPNDEELLKRIAPSFIDRLAEAVFAEQLRGDDESVRMIIRARARGARAIAPQAVTTLLQRLEPVRTNARGEKKHSVKVREQDGLSRPKFDLVNEELVSPDDVAEDKRRFIYRKAWVAIRGGPHLDDAGPQSRTTIVLADRAKSRELVYGMADARTAIDDDRTAEPAIVLPAKPVQLDTGEQIETGLTRDVIERLQTLDRRTHQVTMTLFLLQARSNGKPFGVSPNILARVQGRRSNVGGAEYASLRKHLWNASKLATVATYRPSFHAKQLARKSKEDEPDSLEAVTPWFIVNKFTTDGTPLVMSVNPLLFEEPNEEFDQHPDMRPMPVLEAMVRLDAGREAIEYSLLTAVSREFARGVKKNQGTTRRLGWLLDLVGERGLQRIHQDNGPAAARLRIDRAIHRLAGLGVTLQLLPDKHDPEDVQKAHVAYLDSPALLEAVNAATDGAVAEPAGKKQQRRRKPAPK